MESKNVGFLDISDSSNGLTVIVYVLISTGEVLDGDSLLASIQVCQRSIEVTNAVVLTAFMHRMGPASIRATTLHL